MFRLISSSALAKHDSARRGDAWVTVWNTRIPITNQWKRLDTWIHIHREDDEIIFVKDDQEQRIPITSGAVSRSTAIAIHWRSRGSHFRSIEVHGQPLATTESDSPGLFTFTDRAHTEKYWSWNDDLTFAANGAMTPRGSGSFPAIPKAIRGRHIGGHRPRSWRSLL